jgi:hypothetical protein
MKNGEAGEKRGERDQAYSSNIMKILDKKKVHQKKNLMNL